MAFSSHSPSIAGAAELLAVLGPVKDLPSRGDALTEELGSDIYLPEEAVAGAPYPVGSTGALNSFFPPC